MNLKNLLQCAGIASVALFGCAKSSQTISLFDGKSLNGWEIQNGGQFSVVNGVIKVDRGTGWLRSVDTFADFTLIMEFRFLEPDANSGIFVRTGATSHDDENGWPDNGATGN